MKTSTHAIRSLAGLLDIIPSDVLYEISKHLDPADLSSFLRCNRYLRLLLEPCLRRLALAPKNGHSALYDAVDREKHKLVEYILENQVDVDVNMEGLPFGDGVCYSIQLRTSLLCWAVGHHHFGIIKTLVEKGARIPSEGELEMVGMDGIRDEQLLEFLLDNGFPMPKYPLHTTIDWDIGPYDKQYPACSRDWILSVYLKRGADIERRSPFGDTPLNLAAYRRREKIVAVLLEHHADINTTNRLGHTPLISAVMHYYMRITYPRRSRGNWARPYKDTARTPWEDLEGVYLERGESIVRQLLNRGANINARARNGKTALHFAAISSGQDGSAILLEMLLQNGADITAVDRDGATALHYAAGTTCIEAIRLLLTNGANINDQTKYGDTPLIYATRAMNLSAIRLLLDHGANILICNQDGMTPLHSGVRGYRIRAVEDGCDILNDESVVISLLEHGADLDSKDSSGKTPLDQARINEGERTWNRTGIVKLLLGWEERMEGLF